MIEEYKKYIPEIEEQISKLGMNLVHDEEFMATFENAEDWVLMFRGDYVTRPAIDLSISIRNIMKREYSVRILMKVFDEREGRRPVLPSIANQLDCIATRANEIFVDPHNPMNKGTMS